MITWTKTTLEQIPKTIDFAEALPIGETVGSCTITATNAAGADVSLTILGTKTVASPNVTIVLLPCVAGVYALTYLVTTSPSAYIIEEFAELIVPSGPALITLGELKTFPGLASAPASEDDILQAMIDAASLDFEAYWDNYGVQRSVTEKHTYREIRRATPNADKIQLDKYPIVLVTSITDPAGNTIGPDDYWIDADIGALRANGGWTIPVDSNGFESYWTIVYKAGRVANTASVPANIKHACKLWIYQLYKRPDRDLISKSVGDLSLTFAKGTSEDLPELIKRMISAWKKREV